MTDKQALKYLLKKQREYRKQEKSSSWLQSYGKAFLRTHYQLTASRGQKK